MTLDVCIERSKRRYDVQQVTSVKFSHLIAHEDFAFVKSNALTLYSFADTLGLHCPEISRLGRKDGISFLFKESDQSLQIDLYNDDSFTFYVNGSESKNYDFDTLSIRRILNKFASSLMVNSHE